MTQAGRQILSADLFFLCFLQLARCWLRLKLFVVPQRSAGQALIDTAKKLRKAVHDRPFLAKFWLLGSVTRDTGYGHRRKGGIRDTDPAYPRDTGIRPPPPGRASNDSAR